MQPVRSNWLEIEKELNALMKLWESSITNMVDLRQAGAALEIEEVSLIGVHEDISSTINTDIAGAAENKRFEY